MSLEQSTEVAAGARRRIVVLPTRVEAPVALIMRESEQREALTERLGRRRVVSFPSLAHFCTEEQRRQPWVGIVVGYSCAWDAQLDAFVPHRSCITLYQVPEDEYGWPEGVQRTSNPEQLDAWLVDLLQPVPAWKKALEEARKKPRAPRVRVEPRAPAREPSTERAQLSLPIVESEDKSGTPSGGDAVLGSFSHKAARSERSPERKTITRRIVKSAPPPASAATTRARKARTLEAPQAGARPITVALSSRDIAAADRAGSHLPGELIRLVGEIGMARANELLRGLEANVRAVRGARSL